MLSLIGQAVASGVALGAIYALAASGLGIIFGLFGVINFAHTQNLMIAAVAAFILFGERLSRTQGAGVVLIVAGVTLLAATSL